MTAGHRIFVGYDPSQQLAYDVLKYSLHKHATEPIEVVAIDADKLDFFNRPVDPLALTPFPYTRFLVPYKCVYEGTPLFMDSDMLAHCVISELFHLTMYGLAL